MAPALTRSKSSSQNRREKEALPETLGSRYSAASRSGWSAYWYAKSKPACCESLAALTKSAMTRSISPSVMTASSLTAS